MKDFGYGFTLPPELAREVYENDFVDTDTCTATEADFKWLEQYKEEIPF